MQLVVWLCVVICSCLADNLTDTTSTSAPNLSQEKSTVNSAVPLEFPQYNQNYTFVENSSIRENLASHTDTEVVDLLGKGKENSGISTTPALPVNFPPNPSEENEDLGSKNDTEWIENGSDTEDNKFASTVINQELTKKNNSSHNDDVGLLDGHVAAILAITFLVIAVFAYVGLLMWRRFLEIKYGSREMLVNEDDFIDPNDMKHFSI